MKRPTEGHQRGKTPVIGDAQARALLAAPSENTLKGKRGRAILATFLFHAIRREELVKLKVKDMYQRLIHEYLETAGHAKDRDGPMLRPVKNNVMGTLEKALHPESVYALIKHYADEVGLTKHVDGFCVHALRATAATNALEKGADIAKVQRWLGHANIATTGLYDKRKVRPENSRRLRLR